MAKDNQSPDDEHSKGFRFGMMLGSVVGSAGLYLLGTQQGRKKLRSVIDSFDALDTNIVEDIKKLAQSPSESQGKKVVSDIQTVLHKIETTLPSRKEISRFFAKDGQILK